ncbi:MAG: hypothetical protein SFZ23_05015 [Planctomycetota bacterium]|nr:hypothetical protein [Planctomycetota bacterium]
MSTEQQPADGTQPPAGPATPTFSEDDLKRALSAFKKRHKVTKLDQESKLGASRPMTGGKRFDDIAIQPPREFPREVWRELTKRGLLKDTGGGFFRLP